MNWSTMDDAALAAFVWRAGVSTDALARRLSSLDLKPSDAVIAGLGLRTQALLRRFGSFGPVGEDPITERMQEASSRRFPEHILGAHREAVADGKLGASLLAWMLDVPAADLEEQLSPAVVTSVDVDSLARGLGHVAVVTILLFPDNTVLINFALLHRMDLLEALANGNGRWTVTIEADCVWSLSAPPMLAPSFRGALTRSRSR